MKAHEIRQSFLDFFASKEHQVVNSASLLPESPNLLFTNAGMNQFVPYFLGDQKAPFKRATDTQKCIRAGGKHNDLEDVGFDTYHHTFFEMLGNWSFGDYFKREAIEWSWELLTEVWKFPTERLYATVYKPGEGEPADFDQEAHDFWSAIFEKAGLDPKIHVVNGDKKDNFWMMGETGPCGPCSELHIDLTPEGDTQGKLVNADSHLCIEIWNLVFIQFNADRQGNFSPLSAQHVDTGMGFERVAAVMQSTNGFTDFSKPTSNYDTDVFSPIFEKVKELSGKSYQSTLPADGTPANQQEEVDIAFRVIGDHLRALCFSIADGILPGNGDRNYVLRRILRRGIRYGRTLGFEQPFFHLLAPTLIEQMGSFFPELKARKDLIVKTLRSEEESFNKTLDRGIDLFNREIEGMNQGDQLTGSFAFKLYDTFGFPLDLTELMARESGLSVDGEEFEKEMEKQRERARQARKSVDIVVSEEEDSANATEFVGFAPSNLEGFSTTCVDCVTQDKTTYLAFEKVALLCRNGWPSGRFRNGLHQRSDPCHHGCGKRWIWPLSSCPQIRTQSILTWPASQLFSMSILKGAKPYKGTTQQLMFCTGHCERFSAIILDRRVLWSNPIDYASIFPTSKELKPNKLKRSNEFPTRNSFSTTSWKATKFPSPKNPKKSSHSLMKNTVILFVWLTLEDGARNFAVELMFHQREKLVRFASPVNPLFLPVPVGSRQ